VTYDELRPQVLDGDLVAVRSTRSLLGKLTRLVTRSPYTHTAIALWLDGGLWIAEMDGVGNVLVPLSQYADTNFDVFRSPVPAPGVRQAVLEQLRGHLAYGWLDVLYIGLHRLLGLPFPPDDGMAVCSSYVVRAYAAAGWAPQGLPAIAAPCDVVAALEAAPVLSNQV
jgi:hypothetical protein